MQIHSFICGLQKEKLEDIPHGFDQHTMKGNTTWHTTCEGWGGDERITLHVKGGGGWEDHPTSEGWGGDGRPPTGEGWGGDGRTTLHVRGGECGILFSINYRSGWTCTQGDHV